MGTTVNMDGTALYQAVAVIYIAQALKYSLTFGTVVLVVVIVCIVSVATASIPSAGLLTMMAVLNAIGIDGEQTAMVLAVDWFLDRLRTSVNVFSNAVGVAVIAEISKRRLAESKKKTPEPEQAKNIVVDEPPPAEIPEERIVPTLSSLPDVLRSTKQTFVDLNIEDEVIFEENKRASIVWLENALVAGGPVVISDDLYEKSEAEKELDPDGSIFLFKF